MVAEVHGPLLQDIERTDLRERRGGETYSPLFQEGGHDAADALAIVDALEAHEAEDTSCELEASHEGLATHEGPARTGCSFIGELLSRKPFTLDSLIGKWWTRRVAKEKTERQATPDAPQRKKGGKES